MLAFFLSMALVCRSVPGSVLGNWNDPTVRWSPSQGEPHPHILVILDHQLSQFYMQNYSPWSALLLFSRAWRAKDSSTLHEDRTFKLQFTSLWQSCCCNTPGTSSPGHSVCRHSSEPSRHRNVLAADLHEKGVHPNRAVIAHLQHLILELGDV